MSFFWVSSSSSFDAGSELGYMRTKRKKMLLKYLNTQMTTSFLHRNEAVSMVSMSLMPENSKSGNFQFRIPNYFKCLYFTPII